MISVIVPVYNCEQYLDKSIQSLINQTIFHHLEIVFVDDGSTDKSAIIIKDYVSRYSNMILIQQKNGGVSSARNRGIKEARGEYIAFFDGDDIADEKLYEILLQLIEKEKADLSCVNYYMCFEDGIKKMHKKKEKKVLNNNEIMKSYLSENLICTNPFDKLYKTDIAKRISFPEGYAIGEDMYFVFQYLLASNKVSIDTTVSPYLYCIRNNSAMKSKFSHKNFHPIDLAKKMTNFYKITDELYNYAEANYIHEICKTLAIYNQSGCTIYEDTINGYKKIINSYSILNAFNYLSKKHFIALMLMRISPKAYSKIYNFLHIG